METHDVARTNLGVRLPALCRRACDCLIRDVLAFGTRLIKLTQAIGCDPARHDDVHGHTFGCNFRCKYCMPAEGLAWLQRTKSGKFDDVRKRPVITNDETHRQSQL